MAIDKLPGNLVFDLDGTLLDSLPGIRYSLEAAFRACGLAGLRWARLICDR